MTTKTFLKNKIVGPVVDFLIQGVTPEKLAMAISLGFLIGVFPILGLHSMLTLLVIFVFRLNPGSVFVVSNLVFPMFFVLVIPFLRLGELIFHAQPLPLSVSFMYEMMKENPLKAVKYIGIGLIHAFIGWLVTAIPLSIGIYYIFVAIFRKISTRLITKTKAASHI